jgi:hypothetical protein
MGTLLCSPSAFLVEAVEKVGEGIETQKRRTT